MTPGFDVESVFATGRAPAAQLLAQFEPDPDAAWTVQPDRGAAGAETPDDLQWIVWLDATCESAWAAQQVMLDWCAAVRLAGR